MKLTGSIVGSVFLLFGLGLGWAWYLIIPEYYRSNLGWWEIIGFLASGLIILTSLELVIWTRSRKNRIGWYILITSAIPIPFALAFLGLNFGVELSSSDYPLGEMLLGIMIGFGIGVIISLSILVITLREGKLNQKETSSSPDISA